MYKNETEIVFAAFLARPKDPKVINYFIEVTNLLCADHGDSEEDKGELLCEIIDTLKMTESELQKCHGKTQTVTVRKIMKWKYPNPSVDLKFADVDEAVISAIMSNMKICPEPIDDFFSRIFDSGKSNGSHVDYAIAPCDE